MLRKLGSNYPTVSQFWRSAASVSSEPSTFLDAMRNHEATGVPRNAGIDSDQGFDLTPLKQLLATLNNPQDATPTIHIAGSKGKGSVATLLTHMLIAQGDKKKVGLYTSPHLDTIRERLAIYASHDPVSMIPADTFERLASSIEPHIPPRLTHFEALTAMAMTHFRDEACDYVVLETGLGGMRDATNVVKHPMATVISSIGWEHVDALGGSIESIARAKAGIFKRNAPAVIGRIENAQILDLLKGEATKNGASRIVYAPDLVQITPLHATATTQTLSIQTSNKNMTLETNLLGLHQVDNIATAMATAITLDMPMEAIVRGIQATPTLPARLEWVAPWCLVDGAHTTESIKMLVDSLPVAKRAIVFACAADKPFAAMLREIARLEPVAIIFTTSAIAESTARSCTPGQLIAAWQSVPGKKRCREMIAASVPSALDMARREVGSGGGVLVTGSLHAAAAARRRVLSGVLL